VYSPQAVSDEIGDVLASILCDIAKHEQLVI